MTAALLEVEGLKMHFFTKAGVVKAVDDVSFRVERGRILGSWANRARASR